MFGERARTQKTEQKQQNIIHNAHVTLTAC